MVKVVTLNTQGLPTDWKEHCMGKALKDLNVCRNRISQITRTQLASETILTVEPVQLW